MVAAYCTKLSPASSGTGPKREPAEAPRPVSRRELFARCWNDAPVGDDSLNRAVASLRRLAEQFCQGAFAIRTLTGFGYALELVEVPTWQGSGADHRRRQAIADAWAAWRNGAPMVPTREIAALRALAAERPDDGEIHAALAFLLRLGAECAEPQDSAELVLACEQAAARALQIDRHDDVAATALATVTPIFGDWSRRRAMLGAVLAGAPDSVVAQHELAILEMATGRIAAATRIVARLLEAMPRAPILLAKRIEHLWAAGEWDAMDRAADNALQLWPRDAAIATARFWSLLGTGRAAQAGAFLEEWRTLTGFDPDVIALHALTARALAEPGNAESRQQAVAANLATGTRTPQHSITALIHLGLLGAMDAGFALAEGYYLRRGALTVSLMPADGALRIADQSRRGGRALFHPATTTLRADERFEALMRGIGMEAYWQAGGIVPDYKAIEPSA